MRGNGGWQACRLTRVRCVIRRSWRFLRGTVSCRRSRLQSWPGGLAVPCCTWRQPGISAWWPGVERSAPFGTRCWIGCGRFRSAPAVRPPNGRQSGDANPDKAARDRFGCGEDVGFPNGVGDQDRAGVVHDGAAGPQVLGDRDGIIPTAVTFDVPSASYRHGGPGPPSTAFPCESKAWMAAPHPAMTVPPPCLWVKDWGAWYYIVRCTRRRPGSGWWRAW
jgi:hypothetical protein